ncbi:hypothetical protein SELMODRAFT_404385 [Selaginella moellendorffii]|uniref:Thaumatin-like protein n=1 Tax=Selaginella moellendorffii TaxID=88036 RepID=D8QV60_SELML|nr:hypothetical protein SELMODRAFT_404385 [Selaginella moellendorffii]
MAQSRLVLATWICTVLLNASRSFGINFRLYNGCPFTVWPGWLNNGDSPALGNGGTQLEPYTFIDLGTPTSDWGGRFWGRRGCDFQGSGCSTGDCNKQLYCQGIGGAPPYSIAEFKLGGTPNTGLDFYDVSLVDGYNLPIRITPSKSGCPFTGCLRDVIPWCPSELQVHDYSGVVGCKSACLAFGTPPFCCTGDYSTPQTCKPSSYSKIFKDICPLAYSYAYDDPSSTFTCSNGGDYTITFCP